MTRLGAYGGPRTEYGSFAGKVEAVLIDCNVDIYGFMGDIPVDVFLAIMEAQDVLKAIEENQDVRNVISTDPTDIQKAIVENTDISKDIC